VASDRITGAPTWCRVCTVRWVAGTTAAGRAIELVPTVLQSSAEPPVFEHLHKLNRAIFITVGVLAAAVFLAALLTAAVLTHHTLVGAIGTAFSAGLWIALLGVADGGQVSPGFRWN